MRKFALLIIIAGVGLAVILPWAQSNLTGSEITSLTVYERSGAGWKPATVQLSPDDNPVRMRLDAKFIVDAKLPPVSIPVTIRVSGPDGVVLDGTILLSTDLQGSGPEQEKKVSAIAPLFAIAKAGDYQVDVNLAPGATEDGILDPGLSSVHISVIGEAVEADREYQMPGIVLAILGVYLFMRFRGRRKPDAAVAGKPKNKFRWGRDDNHPR